MSAILDMLYTNSSIMFREGRIKKNLDDISTNFKSAPFELFKLLMLNTFVFFLYLFISLSIKGLLVIVIYGSCQYPLMLVSADFVLAD